MKARVRMDSRSVATNGFWGKLFVAALTRHLCSCEAFPKPPGKMPPGPGRSWNDPWTLGAAQSSLFATKRKPGSVRR
jgi:hypothetical protein